MAAELISYRPSLGMFPLSFGVFVLLLVSWLATGVGSACPRDVSMQANACFQGFSREFQSIKSSPKRLCCGVDVETLRAFCSSYMNAMTCIKGLKKRCPHAGSLEDSMKNLHGAESALKSLCSDDRIIEVYARHQSCITRVGPTTDLCFQRFLNTSDSVRLLDNVNTKHIAEFCSDMRGTLQCIQTNVRDTCGEEASDLVAKLVKPMVRQSTKCDYNLVSNTPVSRQGPPPPSSHDGSWQGPINSASELMLSSSALLLLTLAVATRTLYS